MNIACYHPGYTFVEKLQTIVTKFRREQETGKEKQNLMRQYYDVYSLLANSLVLEFIGSDEYYKHKMARFVGKDKDVIMAKNTSFQLTPELKDRFRTRYEATKALYYNGQPPFEELLERIQKYIDKL